MVDNGAIIAEGGTLRLAGNVLGTGTATIDTGATLAANGGLSVASVAFADGSETLALADPAAVTSVLSGFGAGDVIDLQHIAATSLQFLGGVLTIKDGTATVADLTFRGAYTTADFALKADGSGGTDIIFAAGASAATWALDWTPQDLAPNAFGTGTEMPGAPGDSATAGAYHFTTYGADGFSAGLHWQMMPHPSA